MVSASAHCRAAGVPGDLGAARATVAQAGYFGCSAGSGAVCLASTSGAIRSDDMRAAARRGVGRSMGGNDHRGAPL
jgi:hypothetical protein